MMGENTVAGSATYYKNRAICRKIFREGTGLAVDRMTTAQLELRINQQASVIYAHVSKLDCADVSLARAAVELDDMCSELVLRGVQLQLPV